jgi:hypothetical protein
MLLDSRQVTLDLQVESSDALLMSSDGGLVASDDLRMLLDLRLPVGALHFELAVLSLPISDRLEVS